MYAKRVINFTSMINIQTWIKLNNAAIIIHVLFIQFHIFIHYCITNYVVIGNKSQGEKKKNPYKKSILGTVPAKRDLVYLYKTI